MVTPTAVALLVGALVLLAVWSFRQPLPALRLLLVLLPLHSAATLVADHVWNLDDAVILAFSGWKEAVVAGVVAAAVMVGWRSRRWPTLPEWLALGLVAVIAGRTTLDLAAGRPPAAVLLGARQLAEVFVLFLAVSVLRPLPRWFLGTAKGMAVTALVAVTFGVIQPSLGAPFYDHYFHDSGQLLHHSYIVDLGYGHRFRAVGTFIAPNEFGLGIVVLASTALMPLLSLPSRRRWALAAGAVLAGAALLLSFSRSAWLGAAMGVALVAWILRREISAAWRRRETLRITLKEVVAIGAAVLVAAALLFASIGGFSFLAGTVSGGEASAAGRGESLATGVQATVENLGGLGLGTAGPTALAVTGEAVLTENWYLVYAIQLGVIPLALLLGCALVVAWRLVRQAAALWCDAAGRRLGTNAGLGMFPHLVAAGTAAAFIAALVGGLVIPAFLDLPGSLILWALAATVLGWRQADVTPSVSLGLLSDKPRTP
jgi:hypothetical protein